MIKMLNIQYSIFNVRKKWQGEIDHWLLGVGHSRHRRGGFTLIELLTAKQQGVRRKGFTLIRTLLRKNLVNVMGFTLIELLIVIAVLGVLGTLFMTTFPVVQKRARDARRHSDIRQYQTALEKYANLVGTYINSSGNMVAQCPTMALTNCPDDPLSSNLRYQYRGTATSYVIWASLEASSNSFVVCSNGKVGEIASPSGPVCPL